MRDIQFSTDREIAFVMTHPTNQYTDYELEVYGISREQAENYSDTVFLCSEWYFYEDPDFHTQWFGARVEKDLAAEVCAVLSHETTHLVLRWILGEGDASSALDWVIAEYGGDPDEIGMPVIPKLEGWET